MGPDGYLSAAAQSALLESYAGGLAAATARALADDVRAMHTASNQAGGSPTTGPSTRPPAECAMHSRQATKARVGCPFARRTQRHRTSAVRAPRQACPKQLGARWMQLIWKRSCGVPCPRCKTYTALYATVRMALVTALSRIRDSASRPATPDNAPTLRAWKLFLLAPRMLLARTTQRGAQGREELLARAAAFQRSDWARLLDEARQVGSRRRKNRVHKVWMLTPSPSASGNKPARRSGRANFPEPARSSPRQSWRPATRPCMH